ncbi:hypothetical protein J3R30DRAFT_3285360 [Lentinula aciculospora]|uniref:Uncharacterized protein n=1 Tax=Lentinula aciculospora TaxID=153920 RepID=A0A9W9AK55_9AGAR|nr:hypothetical protein J3R30DRAFT_3285360 [Lentinula aciculospora]
MLCWLAKISWGQNDGRPGRPGRLKSLFHKRAGFPDTVCSNLAYDWQEPSPHIDTLCPLLRRKKILFVGPETTFHLHANLLQAFELHENRSHSCLGTEFCTFHQICQVPRSPDSTEPFFPPGGFKKYPSNRELVASQSGILKYILSNSLYAGSDMQDPRYTNSIAQIDRQSGVRQKERYWLGQARKADVLVLNRGPLPAPAWTYDGTRRGNWSFAQKTVGPRRDRQFRREDRNDFGREKILDIALRVTVETFLPEVVETLRTLSKETQRHKQAVLWHGSWIIEPACAVKNAQGMSVLDSRMDSWTLFYNAQVQMQNHVLRALLSHYRVLFIPMFAPSRRSHEEDLGYSKKLIMGRKDCLRYRFGSILEETTRSALLGGVSFEVE